MGSRPTRDQTMMKIARAMGERSTCVRRQVGAVLVDKLGRVLSTGHNGVPMDHAHCTDQPCAGSSLPSGTGLDVCLATHAEVSALLFCPDVMRVDKLYVTASPCTQCLRALLNTSCATIVYAEEYDPAALAWWRGLGREAYRVAG